MHWKPNVQAMLKQAGLPGSYTNDVLYQMTTESGGNPTIVNTTDCVTLDAMILTRRGWLKHDEVHVGDETIGYNRATKHSEWTQVTRVVHYDDAPLIRLGNSRWNVTTTPNHRWLSMPPVTVRQPAVPDSCPMCPWPDLPTAPPLAECPECGWLPKKPGGVALHRSLKHGVTSPRRRGERAEAFRRRGVTTERGVQIHLARVHGVSGTGSGVAYADDPQWVTTEGIRGADRLLLAAPAETDSSLDVTVLEAALLGWIAGDGHVETGRKNPTMSIAQSKPAMVRKLKALLAGIPHATYTDERLTRTGKVACGPRHQFRLGYRYAQDLMRRAGHPKHDAVQQVLAMSTAQRGAWLEAMTDAEGYRRTQSDGGRERVCITQTLGPVHDAIVLAVYLAGHRPRVLPHTRGHETWSDSDSINLNIPFITGSYLHKQDAGRGSVWCVTTDLGSWTAEDDGHVFLTGNSNYAAGHPSVGLMQVIRGTFDAWAGPYRNTGPFSWGVSVNPDANIYAALQYARHGRGFGPGPGQIGSGHGYAAGGTAKPGWAWVGEQGAELVHMRGGETVVDHAASMMTNLTGLPGYAKGTDPKKARELAELAAYVRQLGKLRTDITKMHRVYRTDLDRDDLWLLQHPHAPKSDKAHHRLQLKVDEAALRRYNIVADAKRSKLDREIRLLRSLTGFPSKKKYGGQGGGGSGSGTGGSGGSGGTGGSGSTAPAPLGTFVGMMPLPPGEAGGGDYAGGGSGGLGGSGAGALGLPGAPGSLSGSPGGPGAGSLGGSPGGMGTGWSITPGAVGGPTAGTPPISGSPMTADHAQALIGRLDTLISATRASPALVGGHLAQAFNGVSRSAQSSARWNTR
jgi:hypothetical protein